MKGRAGKMWRELAMEWQELAGWRGEALRKVWLLSETIEDQKVARDIRSAIIGDFVGYDGTEESGYYLDEALQDQDQEQDEEEGRDG